MTKNNLATHLKWLITQGNPLHPTLAQTSLSERNNHVSQQSICPTDEFAALDDILEDVENETDVSMARLLPQSASKPRMLSRHDTIPTSTPATTKKRASPQQSSIARESFCEPPFSSYKPSRQKSTPLRPDSFHALEHDDIESIDLTGELDRSILSSSETLPAGEPRGPWAEESTPCATREKRGKKRKSDEYTSDLLSSPKHATKVRTASKAPLLPAPKDIVSEQPTIPRQTTQTNPLSAAKRPQYHSTVAPRSHRKQVIADSDDDDDLFDDWVDNEDPADKMILDAEESLYPILPEMSPAADEKKIEIKHLPLESTPKASFPTAQPSTQPKERAVAKDPIPSTPWSKPSSSEEKDPDFLKFLTLGNNAFGHAISKLRSTLQKNSEIVYQQAMEGHPVPELIAENKTLVAQIEAIELLQKHQNTHRGCVSRKQDLKQNLIRVISQGLDPTTMPEELAQSRAVEAELEETESKICELLSRANILELAHDCPSDPPPMKHTQPTSKAHAVAREPPLFSSSRTALETEFRDQQPLPPTSPKKNKETNRPDSYENRVSRNMGTPPFDSMDLDEFDWNVSDDEILEAAEGFDDVWQHPQSPRSEEVARS
ncbi:unnamed protein product [Penicillium egyptiacum]|uniref:Uncharacterized protein n=1 Tax=Penicillium egyptiacum TaxID=1303716 RepID=A0A9W4P3K2_9EURO|nr:unnamed protein product [Penicillium egyptiacum]